MNQQEVEGKVAVLAANALILIVVGLYLTPWLLPLFYDMPEGITLPYYALLLAIEMAPHTQLRSGTDDDRHTR